MADSAERDAALLPDMLLVAPRAFLENLDEVRNSRLHRNALVRSLEVIGEAATRVSPAAPIRTFPSGSACGIA